jgi:hypothetical protein
MIALHHKGFTTEIVEDLRRAYHDQYQESSGIRNEVYEDHYQPLEEEQDLSHNPIEYNEDVTRNVDCEDEAPAIAPQSFEAFQDPVTPAQDEENEVSLFDSFDDTLFYDSENEEGVEPLDKLDPLCLKIEDVEADLPPDDIQILEALAQEGLSEVHCSPFQVLNGLLTAYSARGQLMYHEVFIYVEDSIGSTWAFDAPAQNFVNEISAPLRGLIM